MANEEFYINDREIKDWADLNYSYKEIDVLIERYPQLSCIADDLYSSYKLIENSYKIGGKLLIAGNGALQLMSGLEFLIIRHLMLTHMFLWNIMHII